MLEQRDLKRDLAALALLALTIFLAASLFSYDPADPPTTTVYPPNTEYGNICGRSGAMAGTALLTAFGLGAYYVLLSLAVLDSFLLARRAITDPVARLLGWLLTLAGFSTLSALALPGWSPGPVIGSGGYLGAACRGLLEMNFASVGAYIIVASCILGGLLLSTDYVVFRLTAWTLGLPLKGLGRGAARIGKSAPQKRPAKRSDLDDLADLNASSGKGEPSVKVVGPKSEAEGADKPASPQADASDPAAAGATGDEASSSSLKVRKPRKNQREALLEEIEANTNSGETPDYELPGLDLLLESEPFCFEEHEKDVLRKAKILEKTFADFGFSVRVVEIQTGPVIAQFEIQLEAGLRLSRITGLADDLAIALKVPSVRIVAPIPGKNTVGIEVPNSERQLVRLREVIEETDGKFQNMRIPIFLGKDVAGNPMAVDLSSMPHLLIAGRTGTGKSVCLNSIIVSILMTRRPEEVRMLLIDPKMVELSPYKKIPHLMHPVVTDMRKAEAILAWAVEKMEERYQLLARAGVRHLSSYNQLGEEELRERIQPEDDEEWVHIPRHMPYIVIVADEMADLMMTAAKEVEGHIIRLAQKSRAVGIHLVLATQKPTVDVITGLIKSNLPARIAFEVTSRTDSRVVLDEMGAEKLLGNGDMLFLRPGTSALLRGQGTYLSEDELNRVIEAVATSEPQFVKELVQLKTEETTAGDGKQLKNRDEMYEAAVDIVVREGRGSVSLLQRALGIGYGRAARLIDYMEEDGIVGAYNGSQAREILITLEQWDAMTGRGPAKDHAAGARRRAGKITLAPEEDREEITDPADDSKPSRRTAASGRVSSARKRRAAEEVPFEADEDDFPSDDGNEEEHDQAHPYRARKSKRPPIEDDEEEADEYEDFDDKVEADEEDDDRGPWKAESA